MSEQDLVRSAVELVQYRGGVAIRVNSGLQVIEDANGRRRTFRGAPAGTSDIVGCFRGWFFAAEGKQPGNKPTPLQESFLNQVRAAGGIAFWFDNLDTFAAWLDAMEAKPAGRQLLTGG